MSMLNNVGLVLEGGGMRCAYTAGVLEFFQTKGITFPLVSTASAAALIGSYYIAKQTGENYRILQELMKNRALISYQRLIRRKELFSMDFIFDKLLNHLVPLDFGAFIQANTEFVVATTDLNSGKPIYHDTYASKEALLKIIRASSSLPLLAPSVSFQGKHLMDGGISDPIPIQPSLNKGYKKHVVVLTRNKGYVKRATKLYWLFKKVFRNNPEFALRLKERHLKYNQTMKMLTNMAKRNEVFIIQPEQPLAASRIERNRGRLHHLYHQGYQEAEHQFQALLHFLNHGRSVSAH